MQTRLSIQRNLTTKDEFFPVEEDVNLSHLAEITEGYTVADIASFTANGCKALDVFLELT